MYDLRDYFFPLVKPGQLAGRPVGVKHSNAPGGIFQLQLDAPNSRRVLQVKGSWNVPPPQCDWEELWHDTEYVFRAIDTSRIASQGGPYTLYDVKGQRGSKWAKRRMAVGDVFERTPYVAAFDMVTGIHTRVDGPVRSWLRLAAHHPNWRGVPDVLELWWLLNSPTDSSPYERYYVAKGVGLVGFEHGSQQTYPDSLFSDLPPATGIPVLVRKSIGFPLPPLPETPAQPPSPINSLGFRIVNPARFPHTVFSTFGWRDSPGRPGQRDFHGGVDLTPSQSGPHPVNAAAPGRVVYAGEDTSSPGMANYGRRVDIEHDDGSDGSYLTRYAHLDAIWVRVGDSVSSASQIGMAGRTGWATGVHLHFEVRKDGVAVDPMPYLNAPPPVIPEPPVDDEDTATLPPVDPEPDYEALYHELLVENAALRLRIHNAVGNVRYLAQEAEKAILQLEGVEG